MSFKIDNPNVQLQNQISNLTNNLYPFLVQFSTGSGPRLGYQICLVQNKLNQLGFRDSNGNTLVVDGDFGTNTTFAVNAYKTSKGFNPNGIVNRQTWYSLFFPI
jgi:peptidoglycan hydrolase-like protein with peptidoglycan-binding domain